MIKIDNWHNSPQQWQFWIDRKRINPNTGKVFTKNEAKIHVSSFRKSSIHYWTKRGFSPEEAEKQRTDYQISASKRSAEDRKGKTDVCTNQIGYWLKQGFTEEEAKLKVTERQSTFSLSKCIERHGINKGTKIFNKRQEKWQKSIRTNNDMDEVNRQKSMSLELFLERGHSAADYVLHRIKKREREEYLLKRTLKVIQDADLPLTTKEFNRIYKLLYKQRQKIRGKASKLSLKALIPIYKFCRRNGIQRDDIAIGISGSKEYTIKTKQKTYHYDFCIISKKIIIEYNGYLYHPDPEIMSKKELANFKKPYTKFSVEQKIKGDKLKYKCAEKNGFKLFKIWSHWNIEEQVEQIKTKLHEMFS